MLFPFFLLVVPAVFSFLNFLLGFQGGWDVLLGSSDLGHQWADLRGRHLGSRWHCGQKRPSAALLAWTPLRGSAAALLFLCIYFLFFFIKGK